MKPRYSGTKSVEFWRRVRSIEDRREADFLYLMGCHLQDFESRVLQALEAALEPITPDANREALARYDEGRQE